MRFSDYRQWGMSYDALTKVSKTDRITAMEGFIKKYKGELTRLQLQDHTHEDVKRLVKLAKRPEHLGYAKSTSAFIVWKGLLNAYKRMKADGLIH